MSSKRKNDQRIEIIEVDDDDPIEITPPPAARRASPVEVIDIEESVREQTPLQARGHTLKAEDFAKTQFCAVKVDYDLIAAKERMPASNRIKSREGKTITIDAEREEKAPSVEEQEAASDPLPEGATEEMMDTLRGHLDNELYFVQSTAEDRQAAQLLAIIHRLDTLAKTGSCSGTPVFGYIEDVLVEGRIDEVVIYQSDHMSPGVDPEGDSTLRIITHKARLKDKRPSDIRVNQDSLHGMLLKTLLEPLLYSAAKLDRMYGAASPFTRYLRAKKARLDMPFSAAFMASLQHVDPNHELCLADVRNLHQLLKVLANRIQWLQATVMRCSSPLTVSPILELIYHTPGSDKNAPYTSVAYAPSHVTRRDEYQYDAAKFEAHKRHVLDYWTGNKKPQGVEPKDARYRCGICPYEEKCEWRSAKHEQSWRVNSKSMRREAEADSGANKRAKA